MPIKTIDDAMPSGNKNARLELRLANDNAKEWNETAGDRPTSQFVRDTVNYYIESLKIRNAIGYIKNTIERVCCDVREKARELYGSVTEYVPRRPVYITNSNYRV